VDSRFEPLKVTLSERMVPELKVPLHSNPVLHRVLAARGIEHADQLDLALAGLPRPDLLSDIETAVMRLLQALENSERVLIVGDYDCDGATSTALAMLGLSRAKKLGIDVIVTDHHLPPEELPDAVAIVNPNLKGSKFPSTHLAGVGVMFYVLIALRAGLIKQSGERPDAPLASLLDLVAVGTVADVVPLDETNRILVEQGLRRIRASKSRPGILALLHVAGREAARISTQDIGFVIGPRLNGHRMSID